MLVIRKKRFVFVFVMIVLLLLFTCICSYYFISNVDSFTIGQRKFVAENMIYIGVIVILITSALFGYVYIGSLSVFSELDKLKESVKHGNYDRIVFQKRLGRLGLEINDLFVHLNSISGKKTEKISAISCLNTFLLENIRLKMLVIDVQGMILSVSTAFLTEYTFDKSDILYHNIDELVQIESKNMIVRMSQEHNAITHNEQTVSVGDKTIHCDISFYPILNAKGNLCDILAVFDADKDIVFSNAKAEKTVAKKKKASVPNFFIDFFK
ncbi:MAG: PAS domain-containing protein [Spirochaetales bacterium]|nr:PAS domain-containing protein [Spirochaetales bacterium]